MNYGVALLKITWIPLAKYAFCYGLFYIGAVFLEKKTKKLCIYLISLRVVFKMSDYSGLININDLWASTSRSRKYDVVVRIFVWPFLEYIFLM